MEPLEKLAVGLMKLKEHNEMLTKEAQELRERLENFEKRARAEEILVAAREVADAPGGIRAVTIEDFFEKRAALEEASDSHMDKVAMFVEYLDDGDGLSLSDGEGDVSGTNVINEWLGELV